MNDTLTADMKTAMKAKDKVALGTIRALKTAIKNAAIQDGNADTVLDDAAIMSITRKQIKQRVDSVEQYLSAGREELAEVERLEIAVLEKYLPTALSADEIAAIVSAVVAETGASSRADMGKVMPLVQQRTEGRADGKTLSQAVMQALS
ncbi:GatB/YqeY domain-containing protein [Rubritalea marina]|uniref:GatB/YqeY domain-containing protein n=1 Tax=Rubritalea marina TaxID=361055 RepID=UPI001F0A35A4|nr:GatB/YqeY domain-containing protein [Rubritalea marina]